MRHMALALAVLLLPGLAGCAHVLSRAALDQVTPNVDYTQVRADPQAHLGQTLLLGGLIIDDQATTAGSTLEVLHFFTDSLGRPDRVDEAGGRFLVRSSDLLDPALYSRGRLVTLTGTLTGTETRPLFGRDYQYPVFTAGEIHLWLPPSHAAYGANPYGWSSYGAPLPAPWWGGWYGPYWYGPAPFWRRFPY